MGIISHSNHFLKVRSIFCLISGHYHFETMVCCMLAYIYHVFVYIAFYITPFLLSWSVLPLTGLAVKEMPHVWQSHAIKRFILWSATVAHPKDLWRAIKKFWDIIMKVTPKVYLQLWQRSHWPGSGVSEECSKSKHLNGSLTVLSTPITVFRSKLPKGLGM